MLSVSSASGGCTRRHMMLASRPPLLPIILLHLPVGFLLTQEGGRILHRRRCTLMGIYARLLSNNASDLAYVYVLRCVTYVSLHDDPVNRSILHFTSVETAERRAVVTCLRSNHIECRRCFKSKSHKSSEHSHLLTAGFGQLVSNHFKSHI